MVVRRNSRGSVVSRGGLLFVLACCPVLLTQGGCVIDPAYRQRYERVPLRLGDHREADDFQVFFVKRGPPRAEPERLRVDEVHVRHGVDEWRIWWDSAGAHFVAYYRDGSLVNEWRVAPTLIEEVYGLLQSFPTRREHGVSSTKR